MPDVAIRVDQLSKLGHIRVLRQRHDNTDVDVRLSLVVYSRGPRHLNEQFPWQAVRTGPLRPAST
jgi:hypothetical protein